MNKFVGFMNVVLLSVILISLVVGGVLTQTRN